MCILISGLVPMGNTISWFQYISMLKIVWVVAQLPTRSRHCNLQVRSCLRCLCDAWRKHVVLDRPIPLVLWDRQATAINRQGPIKSFGKASNIFQPVLISQLHPASSYRIPSHSSQFSFEAAESYDSYGLWKRVHSTKAPVFLLQHARPYGNSGR